MQTNTDFQYLITVVKFNVRTNFNFNIQQIKKQLYSQINLKNKDEIICPFFNLQKKIILFKKYTRIPTYSVHCCKQTIIEDSHLGALNIIVQEKGSSKLFNNTSFRVGGYSIYEIMPAKSIEM